MAALKPTCRPIPLPGRDFLLLRQQLDDERGLNGNRNVFDARQPQHLALGNVLLVEAEELGDASRETLQALPYEPQALGPRLDADGVSGAHQIAGNVDLPPVDADMPVADELPRLPPRAGKPQAVHDVVEPPLEQAHQRAAGVSLGTAGDVHIPAELALEDAVVALHFLFLAQPRAIVADLAALDDVHAGLLVAAAFDGAFGRVAAQALQKQFHPFAAAQATDRTGVAS